MNDQINEQPKVLKLLVATPGFGASGQPWLYRQIAGLKRFKVEVLCWRRHNADTYPANGIAVNVLPQNPAPYDGTGRWLYRIRNLPGRNFYASIGAELTQATAIIDRTAPDVILCYFGDIAMRLLPIARQFRVPIIAYFHGDFQFLSNRWYRWSLKRCLRHFAAIVVVTEAEKKWLQEQGVPNEKVHIIPCGAPTEIFCPNLHVSEPPIRFVMASRLVQGKGCHLSIKAFAQVAAIVPGVELQIYGDGPAREDLQHLVDALSLQKKVFFHGYVNERFLAETLPSHDVFIQHSLAIEGSPVSIIEAMACGLPVVCTSVGGIADQVVNEETGLLIPEHDIAAMSAAMVRLAQDATLRQQFGRAGRNRAVNFFDASELTQRLEQVAVDVARL
jgi:glycosyltransferase involved in cell wall biosynthesis